MSTPAERIVLAEVSAETGLLGSLIMDPAALTLWADEIRPEWFSDPLLGYLWESVAKLNGEGHKLSPQAVLGFLPEQCGPMSRNEFFSLVTRAALPVSMTSGLVATVKDRWARRALKAAGDAAIMAAESFEFDPFESAAAGIGALDTVSAAKARHKAVTLGGAAELLIADHSGGERLRGHTTGLATLDAKLNGFVPGQYYLVAGRPGMGKSAAFISTTRRTAESGVGVVAFSLEMSEQEVASRAISDMLDDVNAPTYGQLQRGDLGGLSPGEFADEAARLSRLPFILDCSPRLTAGEIAARTRKYRARFEAQGVKLGVVVVDHLGLVAPSERYAGNKVAETGEISGIFRALAKDEDCCVVALSQLSREVEARDNKRPQLSDLRWSGDLEQDAHVVVFLYREHYYLSRDPEADPIKLQNCRWQLEALIAKNRNGAAEDVQLWCSIAHNSIRDS